MSNFRFVAQDLSLPVFTASGSDAGYPLTNLIDYMFSTQWKGANTTVPQYLYIDVGVTAAAAGIDTLVVHNCNFDTLIAAGCVITLEAASDAAYTTALEEVVVEVDGSTGMTFYTFTTVTKRYWRIKFATALSAVPALGQVFLTKILDTGTTPSLPYKGARRGYQTTEFEALDGTPRASQPYSGRKRWKLSFREGNALSDAKAVEWAAFLHATQGKLRPFYFIDDANTIDYVKLENDEDLIEKLRNTLNQLPDVSLKAFSLG